MTELNLPTVTSRTLNASDPRILLSYFDVSPRGSLATPPSASSSSASSKENVTKEKDKSSSASHSRTTSVAATPITTVSPSTTANSSRHATTRANLMKVIETKLLDRILPLASCSPRVLQSQYGFEKKTEDELVQRLMDLSKLTVTAVKVPDPKEFISRENEPPSSPPASATLPEHKAFITYLRRVMTLGRRAATDERPNSQTSFATLNAVHHAADANPDAAFDWLRLTPSFSSVVTNEDVKDPKWHTPFIRTHESKNEYGDVILVDGALKERYESYFTDNAVSPSNQLSISTSPSASSATVTNFNLSSFDLTSSRSRYDLFRYGVRCALLTSIHEKEFTNTVTLLAKACSTPTYRFDETTVFSVLKLWHHHPGALLERRIQKKAEWKKQLDELDHHKYYKSHAFPTHALYLSWLKSAALHIHHQLLQVSQEIDDLRAREKKKKQLAKSLVTKACACSCFGKMPDEEQEEAEMDFHAQNPARTSWWLPVSPTPKAGGKTPEVLAANPLVREEKEQKQSSGYSPLPADDEESRKQVIDDLLKDIGLTGATTVKQDATKQSHSANMHRIYSGLLYCLLSTQPDVIQKQSISPIPNGVNVHADLIAPSSSANQVAFAGQPSSKGVPPINVTSPSSLPPQYIATKTPEINAVFNPLLTLTAKTFLSQFAQLFNINPVFQLLSYLEILSLNLQRTWSYWAIVLDTIDSLQRIRKGVTANGVPLTHHQSWTSYEELSYLVYIERICEWTTQCCVKFSSVFTLHVNYRSKEAIAAIKAKEEAERERKKKEQEEMKAKIAADVAQHKTPKKLKVKKHSSVPSSSALISGGVINYGAISQTEEKKESDKDIEEEEVVTEEAADTDEPVAADPTRKDDGSLIPSRSRRPSVTGLDSTAISVPKVGPLHPDGLGLYNTHREAFREALNVLKRTWKVLEYQSAHVQRGNAAAVAPDVPPITRPHGMSIAGGLLNSIGESDAPALKFQLDEYIQPYLKLELQELFTSLVEFARKIAARALKKRGQDEPDNDLAPSAATVVATSSTFVSDLHLTLVLHSLLQELTYQTRVGEKFWHRQLSLQRLPSNFWSALTHRTFITLFWSASESYLTRVRIPKILQARQAMAPVVLDPRGMSWLPDAEAQQTKQRDINSDIHACFNLFQELTWFCFSVQLASAPSALSPNSSQQLSERAIVPQTQFDLQHLRSWFIPIVDGFLDSLLDEIDDDLSKSSSSGLLTVAPRLFDRADEFMNQLLNKPCTLAHKRHLIDGLAKLVLAYVEKLMISPGSSPAASTSTDSAVGLLEELHLRYQLNHIYQALFPPLHSLSDSAREKHTKKLLEDALRKKKEKAEAEKSSKKYVDSTAATKPTHKFGYDSVLPTVTVNSIRKLNELRVVNVKFDQYFRTLLLTDDLEQRGPQAHQLQNLLIQSVAFMADGLCSVIWPNTIYNLLHVAQSTNPGENPPPWTAEQVEACFGEALGFLLTHIQSLQTQKLHPDLIRELGMYILLEVYELLAVEIRCVSRYIENGQVFYKKRDFEHVLSEDQFRRISNAFTLLKTFVSDICLVPSYWFESTFPARTSLTVATSTSVPLAQELGLGPYGPKKLENDPNAKPTIQPVNGINSKVDKTPSGSESHTPNPSIGSSNSIGLFAPVAARPAAWPPAPTPKYQSQPAWSSIPWVLCEIWRIEKLLSIHLAPSFIVINLYDSLQAAEDRVAAEKEKNKKSWFSSSSSKKDQPTTKSILFGGPLSEAIHRNAPHPIPKVCQDCMMYLRAHALDEPGLFRVGGNNVNIGALKEQYEAEYASEDGSHPVTPFTEIHDASGLFKLYFRSLPEPVIPFDLYDRFIKVGNNKGADRVTQLSDLVQKLPKENLAMLSSLFHFLLEVSRHSTVNKMTPDNLAIVFAPNLIRPKVETPQTMVTDMASSISVIASLIADYERIFDEKSRLMAAATALIQQTRPQSEEEFYQQRLSAPSVVGTPGRSSTPRLSVSPETPMPPSYSFAASPSSNQLHIDVTPAMLVPSSSSTFITPQRPSSASSPAPQLQSTFPHPCSLVGVTRWDLYRLLYSRVRFFDDSTARDWLAKLKSKPDKPKEVEPAGFVAKLFGK